MGVGLISAPAPYLRRRLCVGADRPAGGLIKSEAGSPAGFPMGRARGRWDGWMHRRGLAGVRISRSGAGGGGAVCGRFIYG